MNKKLLGNYKCPLTKERLHLVNEKFKSDQNIISGLFESETGNSYNIIEGIPDFNKGVLIYSQLTWLLLSWIKNYCT